VKLFNSTVVWSLGLAKVCGAPGGSSRSAGGGGVARLSDGEPRRARDDVEALIVAGMPMLWRAIGVRGECDLAHAEPVLGGPSIFEDAHLDGS